MQFPSRCAALAVAALAALPLALRADELSLARGQSFTRAAGGSCSH